MKRYSFALVAMISLLFVACNKDGDIIINNPEDNDTGNLDYKVIEYLPAPGQFINEKVSGFDNITSMDQACLQAEKRLASNLYVSLGAWGGYITIRFQYPIFNSGSYDFAIAGNSFDSSNEPGIIWVMEDTNGNGLPDEEWYELKGSYYNKEGYQRNYWVTYYKPDPQKNTYWKDCDGNEGYINWLGNYHNQDFYYPNWVKEDSYTLYGSKLPLRQIQDPITGIWSNLPFEWGYADNNGDDLKSISLNGNLMEVNTFKIEDAVNKNGESIKLDKIDFIKVQTAINGTTNILGENSTEICGFFRMK